VTATIAWVSPRVNRAEPCGPRSSPTLAVIGRMSVVERPSMRAFPARMSSRITLPRRSCRISFTSPESLRPADCAASTSASVPSDRGASRNGVMIAFTTSASTASNAS